MLRLQPENEVQKQTPPTGEKVVFMNLAGELVAMDDSRAIETIATVEGQAAITPNPLVFKGLVTQAGADTAPTITVVHNTLGVTITPSYSAVGTYNLTASAPAFTVNKTILTFGSSTLSEPADPTFVKFEWSSATDLILRSKVFTTGGPTFDDANDLLTDLPISIEVYE